MDVCPNQSIGLGTTVAQLACTLGQRAELITNAVAASSSPANASCLFDHGKKRANCPAFPQAMSVSFQTLGRQLLYK